MAGSADCSINCKVHHVLDKIYRNAKWNDIMEKPEMEESKRESKREKTRKRAFRVTNWFFLSFWKCASRCYHSKVICDLYHHLMMPNNSFVVSFSLCLYESICVFQGNKSDREERKLNKMRVRRSPQKSTTEML